MAAAGSRCCEPQLSGASAMQQLACRGTSEPRCPGGWGPRSRILACQPMQERCQRWWEAGWELQAAAGARLGCVPPWTRGQLCDQAPEDLGSGARGWGRRMLRPDCPPWHSTQRTEGPRSEQPFSARQPNCLCSSNQYPGGRSTCLPPTQTQRSPAGQEPGSTASHGVAGAGRCAHNQRQGLAGGQLPGAVHQVLRCALVLLL